MGGLRPGWRLRAWDRGRLRAWDRDDSAVLRGWVTTLRALASARGVPSALLPLAVRAAQGQTGLHGARLLDTSVPTALHVPTLVVTALRAVAWGRGRTSRSLESRGVRDVTRSSLAPDGPKAQTEAVSPGFEGAQDRVTNRVVPAHQLTSGA
ncbi:hypothetical protein [Streptomyces sp. wa22]|uniref:hypothetical protein n=1 Tax=Streptomyces sp. wa22 TaxID=1828244 RepID=UPI0011CAF3FB|nr:hypothetical protein [Streptomyces sp. wa22]TXS10065.1 hypothetical protein EAO68_24765 [Streptomyces sp. wa22]